MSKQTANLDFVVSASMLGGLLESANALSFALINYTFMAANSLKIGQSLLNIALTFGFALISTKVLFTSGLVIGPFLAMSGLIFATALCSMAVYKLVFRNSALA